MFKKNIILRLTNINLVFRFEECGWKAWDLEFQKNIFKIIVLEIVKKIDFK